MNELEAAYRRRFDTVLGSIAAGIERQLREFLGDTPRIDRVSARAKGIASFMNKAQSTVNGNPKYSDPLNQIQDQIGARIVAFYKSDVETLDAFVRKYYRAIEAKDRVPDSEWEFGYFGRHFVLIVPHDVIDDGIDKNLIPGFFELQIKTLFQHAWSEAEHDIGYKPGSKPLSPDDKRRFAFASAQAWGADRIFEELYRERRT
jgi:putative GTP pyrophosphokinase